MSLPSRYQVPGWTDHELMRRILKSEETAHFSRFFGFVSLLIGGGVVMGHPNMRAPLMALCAVPAVLFFARWIWVRFLRTPAFVKWLRDPRSIAWVYGEKTIQGSGASYTTTLYRNNGRKLSLNYGGDDVLMQIHQVCPAADFGYSDEKLAYFRSNYPNPVHRGWIVAGVVALLFFAGPTLAQVVMVLAR